MIEPLTKEHLLVLQKGYSFPTEGLFQGLSKEPLVWTLVDGNIDQGEYVFEVSYYGVKVCEYCAMLVKRNKKKDKVVLERL
jgi:hypothetical protein